MLKFNLVGKQFGRWTAIRFIKKINKCTGGWECVCDCGKKGYVESAMLRRGLSKSCGCYGLERLKDRKSGKNPNWKGANVGYAAIHSWISIRMPHKNTCSSCEKPCNPDLANISQEYKREVSDWEWLCRSCHMKKDGRIEKMKLYGKKEFMQIKILDSSKKRCIHCKKILDRTKENFYFRKSGIIVTGCKSCLRQFATSPKRFGGSKND